jgi:hypothetical protein
MAITVKHSKVSTIPDDANTDLVRPSDWNADHTLVGTIDVANGGTGATTLTGYVKGNGTSAMTAVATVPSTDITGLGTMAEQNANAVAITGGTATLTSVTTPIVQATNSAGLALKNSGGTTQMSVGAGGGDNITVSVPIAINPANALVNISPTGTGTVTINPATAGTINNMSIGATTPSTVNATTITGQTGVLRGTGQNLLIGSNAFSTSWGVAATSLTSGQSDPFGGTNAWTLTGNGASSAHNVNTNTGYVSGITYAFSLFAKKNTNNFVQLSFAGAVGLQFVNFDLNDGTVGTTSASTTGTITSVGGGWYRCTMVATATATSASAPIVIYLVSSSSAARGEVNSLSTSIFIYGSQLEIGSVTNTYQNTTTTAVYGTPTLSFSGVSTIGLESNGALFLQPAGTGALQAQATTSTTAGGNARGANAVDWQTIRTGAAQVASGAYSVVAGGFANTASGVQSAVLCGFGNSVSGNLSTLVGGNSNSLSGQSSALVGGASNSAAGFYNFIGGGFTNTGTANAAVTTQSGTMNATTAVTLSGSNANIRVGQYITGTSIASDTYVAAISGTSLTLSKNASGSSTSTLSFFTPHGVVVGGGNNQATGSYSFIGGGGDAGTAANRNVASGDWSFVGGGRKNTASGIGSFVGSGGTDGTSVFANTASGNTSVLCGGWNSTASGTLSFIGGGTSHTASGGQSVVAGGQGNTASGLGASVLGGYNNTANSTVGAVIGGRNGTSRSITGNISISGSNNPIADALGISQSALLILARQTIDATATALTSDTGAASTTNQVILPNNSAYFFRGEVVSGVTGGGDTKGWTIEGVIKRGANAAATALVGIPTVTSTYADLGAATWDIAVTADTTNGGIRVTFTGQLATTIRTVCQIRTTEMTY